MHELPIVQSILKTVLQSAKRENARRILSVGLAIGDLHDLIPEWVEKYFVYASRGTIAEGASLHIERIPVILRCSACKEHFSVSVYRDDLVKCPVCGGYDAAIVMGQELDIINIEIEVDETEMEKEEPWNSD